MVLLLVLLFVHSPIKFGTNKNIFSLTSVSDGIFSFIFGCFDFGFDLIAFVMSQLSIFLLR